MVPCSTHLEHTEARRRNIKLRFTPTPHQVVTPAGLAHRLLRFQVLRAAAAMSATSSAETREADAAVRSDCLGELFIDHKAVPPAWLLACEDAWELAQQLGMRSPWALNCGKGSAVDRVLSELTSSWPTSPALSPAAVDDCPIFIGASLPVAVKLMQAGWAVDAVAQGPWAAVAATYQQIVGTGAHAQTGEAQLTNM
jgi:hypothetical protein